MSAKQIIKAVFVAAASAGIVYGVGTVLKKRAAAGAVGTAGYGSASGTQPAQIGAGGLPEYLRMQAVAAAYPNGGAPVVPVKRAVTTAAPKTAATAYAPIFGSTGGLIDFNKPASAALGNPYGYGVMSVYGNDAPQSGLTSAVLAVNDFFAGLFE